MANGSGSSLENQFKFILVGDCSCGKTSLAYRFSQELFDKQYRQTVGVDFFLKRVSLPGGVNTTIQLWDIGGQALGGQMLDKYLYGADVIMFVYDITNVSSFENLQDWMNAVRQMFLESSRNPHFALVANKSDLEHMRTVKQEKHLKFTQDNSMSSHCVCAKTGESVNLCFQKIAGELLGIRLTRSEQENAQPVMKAEIIQVPPSPECHKSPPASSTTKTTICNLQ